LTVELLVIATQVVTFA